MLTRLPCISTIQGCSSIRQGVARREASFSSLQAFSQRSSSHAKKHQNVRAFNKILETFAPFDPMLRFVLQLRDWLSDDVREEVNQTRSRLHLRAIRGKGESMLGHFQQRHPQRPDVGRDGVGLPGDPLRRHVVGGADERIGIAFGAEFAAHPKITQLHLAVAAQENVGRLDVCHEISWRKQIPWPPKSLPR